MKTDLTARSLDIHWPAEFRPDTADLFSHNELLIEAPCEKVWNHIIDATNWPHWYPNSKDVQLLNGAKVLGPDVRWRWTTFGLAIESHVHTANQTAMTTMMAGMDIKPTGNVDRDIVDTMVVRRRGARLPYQCKQAV